MIIELIGTWLIVGFFSAIGWNVADETVNKPYLDPWLEKKMESTKNQKHQQKQINKSIKKEIICHKKEPSNFS
jgi:hypothetical protein